MSTKPELNPGEYLLGKTATYWIVRTTQKVEFNGTTIYKFRFVPLGQSVSVDGVHWEPMRRPR